MDQAVFEVNREENTNVQNVWEIGLTVFGQRGDCILFRIINEALDDYDLAKIEMILEACHLLPFPLEFILRRGEGRPEQLLEAVLWLENSVTKFQLEESISEVEN